MQCLQESLMQRSHNTRGKESFVAQQITMSITSMHARQARVLQYKINVKKKPTKAPSNQHADSRVMALDALALGAAPLMHD